MKNEIFVDGVVVKDEYSCQEAAPVVIKQEILEDDEASTKNFSCQIKQELPEPEEEAPQAETEALVKFEITEIEGEKCTVKGKKRKRKNGKLGTLQCDICDKKFRHPTPLKKHRNTHTDLLPLPCNICQKVFETAESLKHHLMKHISDKSYECSPCNRKFLHKAQLENHNKILHNSKPSVEVKKGVREPFICPYPHCRKMTWNERMHKNHVVTHDYSRNFECSVCGQKFKYPLSLKRHMNVHIKEKPFACQICGMAFARKAYLNAHSATHVGIKIEAEDL
ncbi:gastrula zinc finger protein XlCGF7.1-like [Lutzomyia longipalpis]|uniref:gastrula zinc finger protein XlCGF7.1-like n=1 Tax=Lutzomyia longipalpis TaxID=7200 RepID=UPI002483A2A0|nr:gastrula zinc finger protein XlCGF7.1-like [Lutzomyia longipalpis]